MAKKAELNYFDHFVACAEIACEAARFMKDAITNFNVENLPSLREQLHALEHQGDEKKHEMIAALVRAFITPIERNDIMELSQDIDQVIDSIEDILIRIDLNNVTEIRIDSIAFAQVVMDCCDAMTKMLREFPNFRKSKTLQDLIIEINRLEEVGDALFYETMKRLHAEEKDPLLVIAWREIYEFFEKCCDACEDVADVVESITVGNS